MSISGGCWSEIISKYKNIRKLLVVAILMNIKIYLWNTKELAKELGQDRISEKICMHYFLASCLLVLIFT
jgi:hypothetical protein